MVSMMVKAQPRLDLVHKSLLIQIYDSRTR
jgi:hypothetical protein